MKLNKIKFVFAFTLAWSIAPVVSAAGPLRRPVAVYDIKTPVKRAHFGVMIDELRREGTNGQITFDYTPAVRDGSSPRAYRDDLTNQFVADPRFGDSGIPFGEFDGGLILELAHLTTESALELVGQILSSAAVMRFDNQVDFRSATVVVNWPRPADGDLTGFRRRVEAMWAQVTRANGPGRSPQVVMTMDPPVEAPLGITCDADLVGIYGS